MEFSFIIPFCERDLGTSSVSSVAALVFPSIAESFTNQIEAFVYKMSEAVEAVSRQWLFHTAFAGALAFAVYSLVDLLAGDS